MAREGTVEIDLGDTGLDDAGDLDLEIEDLDADGRAELLVYPEFEGGLLRIFVSESR